MKTFTVQDYKKALKGCNLAMKKNIIDRAIYEGRLTWPEIKALIDYAYSSAGSC